MFVHDVPAFTYRTPQSLCWPLLLHLSSSTSALLALMVSLQLLLIGMVADGLLRRVAQSNRALVTSRAVVVRAPAASDEAAPFARTGSR
jgi:hypothetical protein